MRMQSSSFEIQVLQTRVCLVVFLSSDIDLEIQQEENFEFKCIELAGFNITNQGPLLI